MTGATSKCICGVQPPENDLTTIFVCYFLHVRSSVWVELLFDSKGAGVYLPYVSAIPSMQKWKMHPLKIQPIIDMKLSNIAQVVVVMNIHTIDNPCHFLALNVLSMFRNLWHLQSQISIHERPLVQQLFEKIS